MAMSLVAKWKQDTARNTFYYTNVLVGFAVAIFGTYVVYQLQITGFIIGTDSTGAPCTTYCIVPFGKQHLDLNSVLLYMNALTFALSGVVVVLIIAYADYWKNKSLLVTGSIVIYGALTIPVYWLSEPTLSKFNALFSLYIVFGILTSILIALLSIYIPHSMRAANHQESTLTSAKKSETSNADQNIEASKARSYGFAMSIFGVCCSLIAAIIILAIIAALAGALPADKAQTTGLLVTTIIGFITIAGAVGCYFGLPALPAKAWPERGGWKTVLKEPFLPFYRLVIRKNMLFLLLAYTAYTDVYFALSSILGQLYFVQLQPSTLEFTLYALATNIFFLIFTILFFYAHRKYQFSLEKSLIFGYAVVLIVPLWGIIGIAHENGFGNKHRWEFYIQAMLFGLSSAVINPTFRLLYAELIPAGEEVMWFGIQVVLSSATTWITYVVTGPLQNKTHNLRFPLIICFIFLLLPLTLEIVRNTVGAFQKDKLLWQDPEKIADLAVDPLCPRENSLGEKNGSKEAEV